VARKTALEEKNPVGARSFIDEQIAYFKSKMLELIPQGRTVASTIFHNIRWANIIWICEVRNACQPHKPDGVDLIVLIPIFSLAIRFVAKVVSALDVNRC
jgi:hypothetical protein